MKNIRINNKFALAPILIFALTALFSSLCFIFNLNMSYSLILAAVSVAVIGIKFDRSILISCILTISLTVLCVIIAGQVYDFSYDGMYFHKEAVNALANSWNPLRSSFADFGFFGYLQELPTWLDNYPKGVWSLYAYIYSLTGKIEYAKGANIIFILMLFFTAYDTVSSVFNKKGVLCAVLALAFTANPVIAAQFFTFMNDLPVAALIMVCAFFGMKIYAEKADNCDYICLGTAFASSFTIKFTAPILCGFTLLGIGFAVAVKNRNKSVLKPVFIVLLSALIGVSVIGADPYIKHIAHGQNPIFPILGEGKTDIMNTNAPAGIDDMSNAGAMLTSLFSRSAPNPGDEPIIKIPFSVYRDELAAVSAPDTRLGGFGVLFSGILLLSLAFGVFALFKSKGAFCVVPPLIVFALLALFFPESWWARYNPYIYYIPCLILLAFSNTDKTKIISVLMSVLILANSAVTGIAVLGNFYTKTYDIKQKMLEIKNTQKHMVVNINDFPCHALWLKENNMDFELVMDMDVTQSEVFFRTTFYQLQ